MKHWKECDSILLLSGGVDSNTVLADLLRRRRRPLCLVFQYGQKLQKEIRIAVNNAERQGCAVGLFNAGFSHSEDACSLLIGCEQKIPTCRTRETIEADGTPPTYVPFRNGVFLAYAVAVGEAHRLEEIYAGANGLNSGNYWDDTAEFATEFTRAARAGTSPGYDPSILFPFASMKKAALVRYGLELGLDYRTTWSCYENGEKHCGVCDSCVQRIAAFAPNGLDIEGGTL